MSPGAGVCTPRRRLPGCTPTHRYVHTRAEGRAQACARAGVRARVPTFKHVLRCTLLCSPRAG